MSLMRLLTHDVVVWDDVLPLGEGVGTTLPDGSVVTAFEDGAYLVEVRGQAPLDSVAVELRTPRTMKSGVVTLQVSDREGDLVALVMPSALGACPAEGCGGTPWRAWDGHRSDGAHERFPHGQMTLTVASPLPDGADLRVFTDKAKVPVLGQVDGSGVRVFPAEVEGVPKDLVVPAPGDWVTLADASRVRVISVDGDHLALRIGDLSKRTEPLPNPDAVTLPGLVPLLALGLVAGLLWALLRGRRPSAPGPAPQR